MHRKLPSSVEEAREDAQKIRSMGQKLSSKGVYSDDSMIITVISQDELERNIDNLYIFISSYDLKITTLLEQMLQRASQKLICFNNYLQQVKGEIFEFDYRPPYHGVFLVEPFRGIKKVDEWIVKDVDSKNLTILNRFTKDELRVPLRILKRGLRRPARTDKMDLTDLLDYVIIARFDEVEEVLKNPSALPKWRNYVTTRLANLMISRRFDISATGTMFIAYYSQTPTVGVDMWSIKGVPDEDAKILALWFNSTPNLLSTLVHRTETRGAWMKLHEYALKESSILNPDALSVDDRRILLDIYDKTRDQSFPSLLQQLKTKFPLRVDVDKAVLKVLGFGDDEINSILDYLYPALANEIEQLKTLMQG